MKMVVICYSIHTGTYTMHPHHPLRRKPARMSNTYGQFQHLDTYDTSIGTVIAEPHYCHPPSTNQEDAFQLLSDADVWEPWPPNPKDFLRSSLASHCFWLASHPPSLRAVQEYAGQHWKICACFPSFGHIHLLYATSRDNQACAELPWVIAHKPPQSPDGDDNGDDEGPVYLPADLCICDCAIKAAQVESSPAQYQTGPMLLLSHWLCEHGEWKPLVRDDLPTQWRDRSDWNAFVVELYCVAWPADCMDQLSGCLRDRETHQRWLPSVIDAVVSNRDIDALVLQCAAALLLFPSPPSLIRTIWDAIRTDDGILLQWLSASFVPASMARVLWTTTPDRLPPAVWRAAIQMFNHMKEEATTDPTTKTDMCVNVSMTNDCDLVLQRLPNTDDCHGGEFMWLDGHILCC